MTSSRTANLKQTCFACSGIAIICPGNVQRLFFPIPCALAADIKEDNEMFNIAPWPAPLSDIRTLARKEDMNDPTAAPEPRTEQEMFKVGHGTCLHTHAESETAQLAGRQFYHLLRF